MHIDARPHPTRTLTAGELPDFHTHHGVPIALALDPERDVETFTALGHFPPRRFLAAMLSYLRTRYEASPADMGLDRFLREGAEKACGYHHFYAHADAATVEQPELHPENWCVCDDYDWWEVAAVDDSNGALPTMVWEVP